MVLSDLEYKRTSCCLDKSQSAVNYARKGTGRKLVDISACKRGKICIIIACTDLYCRSEQGTLAVFFCTQRGKSQMLVYLNSIAIVARSRLNRKKNRCKAFDRFTPSSLATGRRSGVFPSRAASAASPSPAPPPPAPRPLRPRAQRPEPPEEIRRRPVANFLHFGLNKVSDASPGPCRTVR